MPTINAVWIEAFRAVAVSGTTMGAAELLGIGQPAVSRYIASLERRLGVRLFDREARGLRLTGDGELLLEEAVSALDSLARLQRVAGELRSMRRGHLSLFASAPVSRGLLPEVMKRFRTEHPNITLTLEDVPRRDLQQRLRGQTFDLGFVALPCAYPREGLTPVTGTDGRTFVGQCILPPDHPLAPEPRLTVPMLAGETLIALPAGTVWRSRVDHAYAAAGESFQPQIEAHTNLGELVRAGLGIAIVDPFTAYSAARTGLVSRPLDPPVPYEMAIVRPLVRPQSSLAAAFAHVVLEHAQQRLDASADR